MKNTLIQNYIEQSVSVFHNVRNIKSNLENLGSHLLQELDFYFHVLGITEIRIINSNFEADIPNTPGYNFEYVPTPCQLGVLECLLMMTLDCDPRENI